MPNIEAEKKNIADQLDRLTAEYSRLHEKLRDLIRPINWSGLSMQEWKERLDAAEKATHQKAEEIIAAQARLVSLGRMENLEISAEYLRGLVADAQMYFDKAKGDSQCMAARELASVEKSAEELGDDFDAMYDGIASSSLHTDERASYQAFNTVLNQSLANIADLRRRLS